MRKFLLCLCLFGCNQPGNKPEPPTDVHHVAFGEHGVGVYHDDKRNITCYTLWSNGIYCLPDYQIDGGHE